MTEDPIAELNRIREAIREVATRKANVRLNELEDIVNRLGQIGYRVRIRQSTHGMLLAVDDKRINACFHNRGNSQLHPKYVRQFLGMMIELGLYE